MNSEVFSTNDPVTYEPYSAQESTELLTVEDDFVSESEEGINTVSSGDVSSVAISGDLLTNETYNSGIESLVNAIDPDSVNEEIIYEDRGTFYNLGVDLPDYAVVYDCNGIEVVFPTSYAEDIIVIDGMLVNLGDSYTAGLLIDGYSVDNYLSSVNAS